MKRCLPLVVIVLVLLAVIAPVALAQGGYAMTRSVIAGGGGASAGGPYALQGTIGQPVTGVSAQGDYDVSSGFWGRVQFFFEVYLPLLLRSHP